MKSNSSANKLPSGESRREFLAKTGTAAVAVAGAGLFELRASGAAVAGAVAIVQDAESPVTQEIPARWAAEQLRDALTARGLAVQICARLEEAPATAECVLVTGAESTVARQICEGRGIAVPNAAESFALARGKAASRALTLVAGFDARGLVYGLLELADRVHYASDAMRALQRVPPVCERPANKVRSVARTFASDVEDKAWYQDRDFWTRYFTMLAAQRFNRFHLVLGLAYDFTTNITDCYFHFAYPFLLAVPGYDVRAVPLPDAERDQNLELLRFISDEATRRGIHFQLGVWTHAYHWTDSPKANYVIEGLTPATQGPYCRDALRAVLAACPNIRGVTFRIHGESGVAEGNYDLWRTIFDGVAHCGRPVELEMHAKGMDQGMVAVALGTGQVVTISPKFWAEHMGLPYMQGAIRPQEMPPADAPTSGFFSRSTGSRSFLRYGYGDLMTEDRRYAVLHRLWPGTQRLLLWGNPEMAAAYGRVSNFCGSEGLELMEPLTFKGRKGSGLPGGRDAYAEPSLRPVGGDFEKYREYYRLWGRSLYNPDGDLEGKRRGQELRFGSAAGAAETALAAASRILPLVTTAHCPSAANNLYWPEIYYNMAIVDASRPHPYSDTPSPKRLGTVSPLDPEFFLGIDEFAAELLSGKSSGKYSPAWVAAQLDESAREAAAQLRKATSRMRDGNSSEFRRLAADVQIQSRLGIFFAAKFRAGVLFAIHEATGSREALERAITANKAAREAWASLAGGAGGVYRDDITFGPDYYQRGHWRDRLPAMDADIADMEKRLAQMPAASASNVPQAVIDSAMRAVHAKSEDFKPATAGLVHTPPGSFRRGDALPLSLRVAQMGIAGVVLRYRRVNQAEHWRALSMTGAEREFQAQIPGEFSDSPYPLQYHFQVIGQRGGWLYPGLNPGWQGQPYFVIRQA
jgi:hypothetical protein